MLSEKLVKELQIILKEEYGKDLSYEEALKFGTFLRDYYNFFLNAERNVKNNNSKKFES